MNLVFLFFIYAIGFIAPSLTRSWRGFTISLLVHVGVVAALALVTAAAGGFVVFIFAPAMALLMSGCIVGHIIRLVLLITKWRGSSLPGRLTIIIGIASLPVGVAAFSEYSKWQSRKFYAALPQSTTLPVSPACAPFRNTGPLFDATLIPNAEMHHLGVLPLSDIPIRYPVRFQDMRQRNGAKTSDINFEMYVDDAAPVRLTDEKDSEGKAIPFSQGRQSVSFKFSTQRPVPRAAAMSLHIRPETIGNIDRMASPIAGLELLVEPNRKNDGNTAVYAAFKNGDLAEFIECSHMNSYAYPHCSFRFDAGPIPVTGRFPLTTLSKWGRMRDNIHRFAECSVAAARQ